MSENSTREFRRYEIKLSTNGGFIYEAGSIYKHYCFVGGYEFKFSKDEDIIKIIRGLYGFLATNGISMQIERVD